jgi:4-amino-4-deoxy-L-arabinose transferase-like glycosyltransferase
VTANARATAAALALLAAYLAASLVRPVLPIDETRYLAVAWEVWLRGDWLVPYLNGEPYSHKPPLLFWLIAGGWALTGVNAWWPRVLVALFALGSLFLVARLARLLFPERAEAPGNAALMLAASLPWAYFATAVMFDLVLSFFVLLGCVGLVRAGQGDGRAGWLLFALGLGGGLLAKGPVALLHLLPVALLAPAWAVRGRPPARAWYRGLLLGLLGGGGIVLAWAVPAAIAGGEAYGEAIFWGQTAGRVGDSFAHQEPWWFYLAALPVLLAPWWAWPALWRGGLRTAWGEPGVRFCLAQAGAALVAFSLVSGKQEQYLLPEVLVLAALGGALLTRAGEPPRRRDTAVPALVLLAVGAALALSAGWLVPRVAPAWSPGPLGLAGVLVALSAVALLVWRPRQSSAALQGVALAGGAAFAALAVGLAVAARPAFDLDAVAARLRALEAQGLPLANEGKYHGQFHFPGRLQRPIEAVAGEDAPEWLRTHPTGRMVVYYRTEPYPGPGRVEYRQPYRGKTLAIVAPP